MLHSTPCSSLFLLLTTLSSTQFLRGRRDNLGRSSNGREWVMIFLRRFALLSLDLSTDFSFLFLGRRRRFGLVCAVRRKNVIFAPSIDKTLNSPFRHCSKYCNVTHSLMPSPPQNVTLDRLWSVAVIKAYSWNLPVIEKCAQKCLFGALLRARRSLAVLGSVRWLGSSSSSSSPLPSFRFVSFRRRHPFFSMPFGPHTHSLRLIHTPFFPRGGAEQEQEQEADEPRGMNYVTPETFLANTKIPRNLLCFALLSFASHVQKRSTSSNTTLLCVQLTFFPSTRLSLKVVTRRMSHIDWLPLDLTYAMVMTMVGKVK